MDIGNADCKVVDRSEGTDPGMGAVDGRQRAFGRLVLRRKWIIDLKGFDPNQHRIRKEDAS